MADFLVTIERKITRRIRVSAASAAAARAEIEAYGEQEAWSDYSDMQEVDVFRLTSVKKTGP
jgi:hypothetical protein